MNKIWNRLLLFFLLLSTSSTLLHSYALPTYTPQQYNLMKPLSEPFPTNINMLKNKKIVKTIIMNAMNYSISHPNDIKNYFNILIYSFIFWDLSSKGSERELASKIGLQFANRAIKLEPNNPLIQYMRYVFEDLNSVSYREINGATKVLKIISKYKKMTKEGNGCIFAGGPYRNLARTYYKISSTLPLYSKRSIDMIIKALKCKNKFSMNYLILGDIYLLNGQPKNAEKIFNQIKLIKPQSYMEKLYQEADYWTAQKELKLYKSGKWNIRTDWVYDRGGWWQKK